MDEQESISTNEDQAPWGGWEWLKTILFLAILFVAGFVTIRVAGPMLFTDYVPGIIGLDSQDADMQIEDGQAESPDAADTSDSATGDTDEAADSPRDDEQSEADNSETGQEGATEEAAEETTVIEGGDEGETAGKAEEEGEVDAETSDTESSPSAEVEVYIVKVGDTLTSIAATFGVTIEEIVAVNQFLNPNYVQVGQEINIPK